MARFHEKHPKSDRLLDRVIKILNHETQEGTPQGAENLPAVIESRAMMSALKTFWVWFLVGAGLLISGSFAVVALREFIGTEGDDYIFMVLLSILAISGGVFTGILALAVRRIIEPLPVAGAALHGEELMLHAARLGVSRQHIHDSNGHLLEVELQRRVLEMEKAIRERRGYVVAVSAAVISAFGALAAWVVHLK